VEILFANWSLGRLVNKLRGNIAVAEGEIMNWMKLVRKVSMGVRERFNALASFFQLLSLYFTDPETRVRFPALPDFLRSSGSGTGSTQPRE
jgi:hypothetical protein